MICFSVFPLLTDSAPQSYSDQRAVSICKAFSPASAAFNLPEKHHKHTVPGPESDYILCQVHSHKMGLSRCGLEHNAGIMTREIIKMRFLT